MPISIAVTNIGMAREFAVIDESRQATIDALHGLPITFIVSSRPDIHDGLVGNDSTLAFRFPQHQVAEALIDGYGPLTTTSANIHGKEDPIEVEQAASQFGASVPLYIRGRRGKFGRLTTLLDIRRDEVRIIRYGAATRSEIQAALVGRKVV
jgi:L-threonylcarbamoyladenylate synthase